jgi:hypothetical protein
MALYQESSVLTQVQDKAFTATHTPGTSAPFAGIYRCTRCNHEIGIAEGHTLPAQTHGKHPESLGDIIWQLAVFAQHN